MLKRLLDSPWTYFGLAGSFLVLLLVLFVDVRLPPRPRGSVDEIRALAQRDDINVVFVVIDTLRADRLHSYGYSR